MSPRTAQQFEEIRVEKMTLIMDVALEQFANNGYHATTINHIARHAGISKGLLYNYFKSKEDLLAAIIQRSVTDVYENFDVDRDGFLSGEEFEFFIRKIAETLKTNQIFWRLFFQLLMQTEVREQFLMKFLGTRSLIESASNFNEELFISRIMKTITEYFIRKKDSKAAGYDPWLELNMFILTIKGFAITYIFMEESEDGYYEKTVTNIIDLYK